MLKLYKLVVLLFLTTFTYSQSTNTSCINAAPICANGISFTTGTNSITPAVGNNYDCVSFAANPSWYYFEIAQAGDIHMSLQGSNDLDFVIWGPFTDTTAAFNACGNLGNAPNPLGTVDCGFIGGNTEFPDIYAAAVSEIYIMMLSNFAGVSVNTTLTQTGGSGSFVCPPQSFYGAHIQKGTAYYDMNQNGLKEPGESSLPNVAIDITPLTNSFFTNANGDFYSSTNDSTTTNYTVSATLPNWSITNTPANYTFLLDSLNYTKDSLDFGFFPDSLYYHATMHAIDIPNHCITNNVGWFNFLNDGTEPIHVQAAITLDPDLVFVSASVLPDSVLNQTIYFSFDSIAVYKNISVQFTTNLNGNLSIGDMVQNQYHLSIFDYNNNLEKTYGDSTINSVVCSYDPNDKTSFIANNAAQETIAIGDFIDYTIRFQNTGTAEAINIVIKDTVDFNLDLNSFQFLSSSHLTEVTIDNNREISFLLHNIHLPDHISNEPGSHGYITYRIYPNLNLDPNTVINNTAYIYFDNNSPIITNTTLNKMACYILPDSTLSQNDQLLSVLNAPNYSYQWYLDSSILTNATAAEVQINGEGLYHIVIVNEYGCTSTAEFDFECISTIDSMAIIQHENNTLWTIDSVNYSYSWYLNGILWSGATDHFVTINGDGEYTVIIKNEYGCQATGTYNQQAVGLATYENKRMITYPIPAEQQLNIQMLGSNTGISNVKITNLAGEIMVFLKGNHSTNMTIDISDFSKGVYLITVSSDGESILTEKLIKI
ncbi:hypothetical protein DNU06_15345 [Putridiphycobacter roseus]|uniref:Secretion system C-terminal sorting domain-containing protein n=1 Tax=Putridiphycobacter roseus TaxID=2219161 RepID=A0A2W1MZJ1_9FLAO|nr:T9SS type A sorting domain-containing protein [Putridiphycobacter roseus]PZE16021.1 hypothetical protein DNU06_15345 [Putridiphycobacter roseus]